MRMSKSKFDYNFKRDGILLTALIYYFYNFIYNWGLINWAGFRGEKRFIDLHSVLKSAECFKINGLGIYSDISHTPCQGYMYGRELIFAIQALHLHPSQSSIIGLFLTLITVLSVFVLLRLGISTASILFTLAFTPGISLLLERGNVDGFIGLIVISAAFTFEKNLQKTSIALLLIASSFKFYTLPLTLLVILICKNSWKSKVLFLSMSFVLILDILFQLKSTAKVPGTWFISFGVQIFGEYLDLIFRLLSTNIHLSNFSKTAIGIICLITSFKVSKRLFKNADYDRSILTRDSENEIASIVGIFSYVVFISCYLTGISYDYRIIFYVLAINGMLLNKSSYKSKFRATVILSILCTTIFPTGFVNLRVVFQLVGDVAMLLCIPRMTDWYVRQIKEIGNRDYA
jgi:hypothetical protein